MDDDDPLRGRLARAMEERFSGKRGQNCICGLNMAKTAPTAFAIVDLRLEDGNGLDVVKELSKIKKIVMLTDTKTYH